MLRTKLLYEIQMYASMSKAEVGPSCGPNTLKNCLLGHYTIYQGWAEHTYDFCVFSFVSKSRTMYV